MFVYVEFNFRTNRIGHSSMHKAFSKSGKGSQIILFFPPIYSAVLFWYKFKTAIILYGMEITFNEFKRKDVLDVCSGKNLGRVSDLVIEAGSGRILKIIVPGKKGGFLSCENLEIKYKCITKIGDDAILVDLENCTSVKEKEFCCDETHKKPDLCCCGDGFCDE